MIGARLVRLADEGGASVPAPTANGCVVQGTADPPPAVCGEDVDPHRREVTVVAGGPGQVGGTDELAAVVRRPQGATSTGRRSTRQLDATLVGRQDRVGPV